MRDFCKCPHCRASNRASDSHCYSCQQELANTQAYPTSVSVEMHEISKLSQKPKFYGKVFLMGLALLICYPYFTQNSVYGIFEWAILPFHEAGHYILMPFAPRTLMVAAGSIVQICLPLSFAIYFFFKRKEPFSSCIPMLWLFGSMQQMAIYMKDTRFLLLPLLGADPTEGHDWNYLFGKIHLLHKSVEIGDFFLSFARVGICLTLIAMAILIVRDPASPWAHLFKTRQPLEKT